MHVNIHTFIFEPRDSCVKAHRSLVWPPLMVITWQIFNTHDSWRLEDPSLFVGKVLDLCEHGLSGVPPSTAQRHAALTAVLTLTTATPLLCTPPRTKLLIDMLASALEGRAGGWANAKLKWGELEVLQIEILGNASCSAASLNVMYEVSFKLRFEHASAGSHVCKQLTNPQTHKHRSHTHTKL